MAHTNNINLKAATFAAFMFLIFAIAATPFNMNAKSNKSATPITSRDKGKGSENSFLLPDFSFPETVEKNAGKAYRDAVVAGKGVEALQGAIQLIIAKNLVSESSFSEGVALLDSIASQFSEPSSSLAILLEANLYSQLYSADKWRYDSREMPTDSYPADATSWSGDLFAKKILQLTGRALKEDIDKSRIFIKEISPIIENVENATKAQFTVYDFMVCNSIRLLSQCAAGTPETIPFTGGDSSQISIKQQCREKALDLADEFYANSLSAGKIPLTAVAVVLKASLMDGNERQKYLEDCVTKMANDEWAGYLLDYFYHNTPLTGSGDSDYEKRIYGLFSNWLELYPSSMFAPSVKYDIAEMSRPTARVNLPSMMLPNKSVEGEVALKNVNDAYVLIYSVPESLIKNGGLDLKRFPAGCTLAASIPVKSGGEVPFSSTLKFTVPALKPGHYVALPSPRKGLPNDWRNIVEKWSVSPFHVTDITMLNISDRSRKDGGEIYVVDATTQSPINRAEVKVYSSDNPKKLIKQGFTGDDGSFPIGDGNYYVEARKGDSMVSNWMYNNYYKQQESTEAYSKILTDRAIYKPGDEVRFALVGWTLRGHETALLKNEDATVVLRDANWNPVDTLKLTTDEAGRCNGALSIPKEGLLGTYQLSATFGSRPGREAGSARIEVAQYKTPGFFVEVRRNGGDLPAGDDTISFSGVVKTYSGMPLGGCQVAYNIEWSPWWRTWRGGEPAKYSGTLTTDEKGEFVISLGIASLKSTRFESGIFTLTASATSPSGETQSSDALRFSLARDVNVSPDVADVNCIRGEEVRLNVPVYDILGLPVNREVEYVMKNAESGAVCMKGIFFSPTLVLKSGMVPSGKYDISFNVKGDTIHSDVSTIFYRESDERPPYPTPLWVPQKEIISADGAENVEVTFGSSFMGSSVLAIVTDTAGIVSKNWITVSDENRKMKVKAPMGDNRVWVSFSGMHDFDRKTAVVTVVPEISRRNLKVKALTFRDKISAGGKEKWSFKFSVDGDSALSVNAFAVMTDKSLNVLAPFKWNFGVNKGSWWLTTNIDGLSPYQLSTGANFKRLPSRPASFSPLPEWISYGYPLAGGGRFYRPLRSVTAGTDCAVEASDMVNEVKMEKMMAVASVKEAAAPAMAYGSFAEDSIEENDDAMDGNGASEASAVATGSQTLRPAEMPVAFFMPQLESDDNGNLAISFEVPDYNTTWQFQVMGYTEDLLTSGLIKDAVASKPVMVRGNMPRFLRSGDKALLSALIFNNSGEQQEIGAKIIVLDGVSGKVVSQRSFAPERISPSANKAISLSIDVPSDIMAFTVRVYAETDEFADGEQALVPVLPSSTPVVESTQFYLGRDKGTFDIKLPKYNPSANLTLKYCDNPLWDCVMALPAIADPDSRNVLGLAKALYANSVAAHICSAMPEIRNKVEEAYSRQPGAFVSNLQKDSTLKTVALTNTPWVNDAASETARMGNLVRLMEDGVASGLCATIGSELSSLQSADGAWSWCKGMSPSLYITKEVLLYIGLMRQTGINLAEGNEMIAKAIRYCDKMVTKDYATNGKKISLPSALSYLYVRSFFEDAKWDKPLNELKREALSVIGKNWGTLSIYDKAIAALVMHRLGGDKNVVEDILESLTQYAVKSESNGWRYDNLEGGATGMPKLLTTAKVLEAFAEISPSSEAVDGLRQWIVLQKETEDWGSDMKSAEVVYALLSSGTAWNFDNGRPEIRIDGKRIETPAGDAQVGALTITLDAKSVGGKRMTVKKSVEGPAWGGVVCQLVQPIADVRSRDCESLSLEKQVFIISKGNSDDEGRKLIPLYMRGKDAACAATGDKIRVSLVLTCHKDMDYVALTDERAGCLEPARQISEYVNIDGLWAYKEVRDTKTTFFIDHLPKGTYVVSYDCYADREGEYSIGIASAQSQYSPLQTAHSAGGMLKIKNNQHLASEQVRK